MSETYKIVERLDRLSEYEFNLHPKDAEATVETAKSIIQELAEALETARGYVVDARTDQHAVALSRAAHPKIYARENRRHASICDDVQKIDAILSKLNEA